VRADLVPAASQVQAAASNGIEGLRHWIMTADDMRAELAEAGDYQSLAFALAQLRTLMGDMRMLTDAIEANVADLMPERRLEMSGVGVFEKRRATARKQWDWQTLLDDAIGKALVDPETGELPSTVGAAVQLVVDTIMDVAPLTPSANARVGALKERGLDPGSYCEEEARGYKVQVIS
jgi:hypothetical protein